MGLALAPPNSEGAIARKASLRWLSLAQHSGLDTVLLGVLEGLCCRVDCYAPFWAMIGM